jgi:hypothetical protein
MSGLARGGAVALILVATAGCGVRVGTTPEPAANGSQAEARGPSTAARLGIPPGHLPPPGRCKIWIPGDPPGHQARARDCSGIEHDAPAGSWVLYRPSGDKKVVHVREMDHTRLGVVIHISVYEASSGRYMGEAVPGR